MPLTKKNIHRFGLRSAIALGAFFAVYAVSHMVWLARDDSLLVNTDARHHFVLLRTALDRVATDGIIALPNAVANASLGGRPPLYAFIAAPFFTSFGRSEDAAVLVNLLFAAIMAGATWWVAERCRGPASGLLAGLLVLCYAPVTQLFRTFLPHAALPACVALTTALLVELFERRTIGASWALGASLAFGLLVHPSFAWIMVGPTALVVLWVLFTAKREGSGANSSGIVNRISVATTSRLFLRGLLPASVAALSIAAAWYTTLGRPLFAVWISLDTTPAFAIRGFDGVDPGPAWYVATAPGGIGLPFAILGLFGLLRGLFGRDTLPRILAISFVCAHIGLLQQPARAWWYFAAALPFVAVLSAISLADLFPTRIYRATGSAVAALAVLCWGTVTWGTTKWTEPVMRALGAPLGTATCSLPSNMVFCPHPPAAIDWQGQEIAREILQHPPCRRRTCTLMLINPARYSPTFVEKAFVPDWPNAKIRVSVLQLDAPAALGANDFLLTIDRVQFKAATLIWPGYADFIAEYPESSKIETGGSPGISRAIGRLFRRGPSFRLGSTGVAHLLVSRRLPRVSQETPTP